VHNIKIAETCSKCTSDPPAAGWEPAQAPQSEGREWWIAKTKQPGSFSKGRTGSWFTAISHNRDELLIKHKSLAASAVHVIEHSAYLAERTAHAETKAFYERRLEDAEVEREREFERYKKALEAERKRADEAERGRDEMFEECKFRLLDRSDKYKAAMDAGVLKWKDELNELRAQVAILEQENAQCRALIEADCAKCDANDDQTEQLAQALGYYADEGYYGTANNMAKPGQRNRGAGGYVLAVEIDRGNIARTALAHYRNGTIAGAKTPSETDIDPERDERFGGR